MSTIGIVVAARDALPYIETLLTTVNAQTHPCAAYIVDDASTDGMTQFLADRPAWWRRHQVHDQPVGWAQAVDVAAQAAIGDGCDAVFLASASDFLRLDCIAQCARLLDGADAVLPHVQQVGGTNTVQGPSQPPEPTFPALVRADAWTALGGHSGGGWWVRFDAAGYRSAVVTEPLIYRRTSA